MNNKFIPITLSAVIAIAMIFTIAPMDVATTTHVSTPSASTVTTASIAADTIIAADIATGAVATAEILDGTILTADIATGGVATADILDGTILTADIATGGVATADILDATIVTADIATGGVATINILDDTIGPEDVTGVTAAAGFIHVEENTSVTQVVATTAFTPVVSSVAIVTCDVSGDATAAITAGVITLTEDGTGTVQSTAARQFNDADNGKEFGVSAKWVVTGITDATIFTCTTTGTNNDAAVDSHNIVAIFMPA
jgi:hypothetical protein